MRNGLSHEGVRPPNMSAATGPEDPDCRVHAAWLAEVSKADDGLLAKEAGGSTSVPTSSSAPADRLAAKEVCVDVDRRPGLITKVLIGSILAAVLAVIVGIPSYLSFFATSQQPTGDAVVLASPDRAKSATPPMQPGSELPKLVIEPTRGLPGEPVPLGLALHGPANDAVVILRGLVPGMELSSGSAVTGDSWQLSATDLPDAWIAPPKDFVGSADLVAELRLANAQIADRQTLHVKWVRPAAPTDEHKHEQLIGQKEKDIDRVSPIAPAIVQPSNASNDGEAITPAPPISASSSQGHVDTQEGKSAGIRRRTDLRRSSALNSRGAPLGSPHDRNGTQTVKGFWDWSR
jgi:hypothetical protein